MHVLLQMHMQHPAGGLYSHGVTICILPCPV